MFSRARLIGILGMFIAAPIVDGLGKPTIIKKLEPSTTHPNKTAKSLVGHLLNLFKLERFEFYSYNRQLII